MGDPIEPSATRSQDAAARRTAETNKELVREFFAAWARSDFDHAAGLLDLDGQWWTLANRKTRSCRDQLARVAALNAETRTGTIDFLLGDLTAEEDRVAVVVESHAEFPLQGHYSNLYHFLFRISDGGGSPGRGRLISHIWVYYDTALANRVLRGVGATTPPLASHAED
jgi:ketosteroid isomerase-like protein